MEISASLLEQLGGLTGTAKLFLPFHCSARDAALGDVVRTWLHNLSVVIVLLFVYLLITEPQDHGKIQIRKHLRRSLVQSPVQSSVRTEARTVCSGLYPV